MEIKYIKSAARPLKRGYVNKGGLDLSKEILWPWISVGQRAEELSKLEVKEILPLGLFQTCFVLAGPSGRIFFSCQKSPQQF